MKSLFAGLMAASVLLCAGAAAAQTQFAMRPVALAIDWGSKSATAIAGAATLNKGSGVVTSEALTTAAGAIYTLTLADSSITATDIGFASVSNGTNTAGLPEVATVTPGAGTLIIVVHNDHATAALNGTLKIGFFTLKN